MSRFNVSASIGLVALVLAATAHCQPQPQQQQPPAEVERAVLLAAAQSEPHQEESYQKVYEAFTKLMQNVSNNSLGNVRRLVSRLNQLVGAPATTDTKPPASSAAAAKVTEREQQTPTKTAADEKTEQILNRLDKVTKDTDQNTLRQLNEDIGKLVGTLSDSYLRNIRRVIERVNKVVGQPSGQQLAAVAGGDEKALHQSGDRLDDPNMKQPGFPGWDELIVAMDRVQKSLAHFVRSSTRLITSG